MSEDNFVKKKDITELGSEQSSNIILSVATSVVLLPQVVILL